MSFSISIHSSKGGTGKTCIAQNLAYAYAMDGKNVCLLDLDLKSPSLFSGLFPVKDCWLNSVLEGRQEIDDVLVDATREMGTKGRVCVGYSNPDIAEIREISLKDRRWQSQALQKLIDCKKKLFSSGFDVVIMDSSPGVDYTSVNVVACSEYVITVFKSGESRGVQLVINGIYKPLEKRCFAIENMNNGVSSFSFEDQIPVPVLARIPCMCDVSKYGTKKLFTCEDPAHPFSKAIFNLKDQIC
ncbi:MinD/ParA family protein [Methanohalophilus sp.]|uniref:ParA family protein n=1 Tax=Methanohalophilus sp. TaxID=1966352 RepID=UPI0026224CEB|nr:MinD/ParA family protein [Methanohalophilus sp.]MDK2891945.1 hypothetical protein [Methanohalophilus sp.]